MNTNDTVEKLFKKTVIQSKNKDQNIIASILFNSEIEHIYNKSEIREIYRNYLLKIYDNSDSISYWHIYNAFNNVIINIGENRTLFIKDEFFRGIVRGERENDVKAVLTAALSAIKASISVTSAPAPSDAEGSQAIAVTLALGSLLIFSTNNLTSSLGSTVSHPVLQGSQHPVLTV